MLSLLERELTQSNTVFDTTELTPYRRLLIIPLDDYGTVFSYASKQKKSQIYGKTI